MSKPPKEDWYWPLGSLGYVDEIRDSFPIEAELIGVITILWNRQELALQRIFEGLVKSRNQDYITAIWNRQPTHQAKRDLLALAITTAKLTKRQKSILTYIVDRTKTVADRRNELIHAEYVVQGGTDRLHAKVSSPRSTKPPKYQKTTEADLTVFAGEMQLLLQITEGAWLDFMTPKFKRFAKSIALSAKVIL